MRTLSATEQALLQSGAYAVHCRVLVRDAGGIFRDLSVLAGTDWVVEARWDDDIDFPVAQAEVTLWREGAEGSLSPFVGSSPLNAGGPLLDAGREIRIETAVTPPGAAPAAGDWRLVFQGYIDHVAFGRRESRVTIQARDLGGLLLDTWIEEEKVYGSEEGTPVEEVMQQILDATLGAEVVQLVVPHSPGFLITPYTQEPMSLMEALQRLADLIGWTVRYRWHEPSGAFRLTFYEPPRSATAPVWTFGADDYLDVADLNIDRAGVRNVIEVSYRDAASGERKRVTASDAQSVARYGRRWMQIQEADTSPIDTEEEAQALADAALADLAQPKAEQEIELHYWWPVELNDLYRFLPNGVHYDEAQDLAVVSWRHELAADRARTFIRTRGRPAGAYRRWYRETRDWLAAPAVTPTLDEDDGVLYLRPNRNEHCGSVRWAVSTSGPPTIEQVRAGPLSTADRIQVHVFGGVADERIWVGVLPLRHPDGTGGEGALVTLPYTHRVIGAIAPTLTWFPIAPSAPDKDAVRIVANDDGDQVALYYRTYSKGSTPPAFTRVPSSGFLPDPITLDIEVATPAKGQPNIVVEAYAEDDEGHTTPRRVVIELDHGEEPSGEVVLEVDADGRVYVQVSSTDSDTGSARFRAVRGSVTTPTYEALTFSDDTDPADGKTERGISLAEFGTRIDTGIVLDQFQAAYVVVQFFRTLSSLGAAQQGSRASAEIRSWRAMTAVRPPRANIRVVDSTRTSETLEYQGFLAPLGVGPLQYRRRVIDQDVEGAWGPGSGDGWASMPPSGFPQQTIQRARFWPRTVELQVRDAHLQVAEARHTIAPELPALDPQTGTLRPDVELADGSGIFRKPSPGAPDTADSIPDGETKRVTTIDEAAGGGRAFQGLLSDGTVAPGKIRRDFPFADGKYAVTAQDPSGQVLDAVVTDAGGRPVRSFFAKPSPTAPDTADAIPDGTTKRVTTINEATGGGRAFVGLLADGTVAPGKVVATSIQDGAVIRQKIATGAVAAEHIQDGAVTRPKIATGAVAAEHIQDGAVSAEHIQDGAVTRPKISAGAVYAEHIQDGAVSRQKIAAGAISDEHYSSSPSDKLATAKYRLPPTVEVEVLSSTEYQITFRVTARDADGGRVRILWRVVNTPSESYTTPTPSSSGALQPQPFTMNVTVDRDSSVDTLFEVWSEDEDGNRSAIARRTIPRIVAPENALTNVSAALFLFGSTCPSQLVDRVTWTVDPAVPASWRVEVWIIEGTTTGDPFTGTRLSSNATSPFNTTRLTNVRTGSFSTYNRRYGVRLLNSRGSVIHEARPFGLSTGYEICPI